MLAAVIADICREAGVTDVDVSAVSGVVRGLQVSGGETGRAALQPILLAHGLDVVERDGHLRFVHRDGRVTRDLGREHLAIGEEVADFQTVRQAQAELSGRLRLSHVESGGDYATATAEVSLADADGNTVSDSEFAMCLTRAEGRAMAGRGSRVAGYGALCAATFGRRPGAGRRDPHGRWPRRAEAVAHRPGGACGRDHC